MYLFLIFVLLQRGADCTKLTEAEMSTSEIIRHHGYPVEEHVAVTDDGYHLLIHRIPHGRNEDASQDCSNKPVVFLQHGFVGSSAIWVTSLPSHSAGFIFADAGFDVWMGNFRGNTYSLKHDFYDMDDSDFWQFTFDELSRYDLEAMIDKALNVTGRQSLYYVGYSEGTMTMFVKLASSPTFASKVQKFFALAPMRKMEHFLTGVLRIVGNYVRYLLRPMVMLFKNEKGFFGSFGIVKKLNKLICGTDFMATFCDLAIYQTSGGKPTLQINQTRVPIYSSHFPAGSSMANALHWLQVILSNEVRMYDYGSDESNLQHYGTAIPPLYDFRKISAPTYLYWSEADWLTDTKDVKEGLLEQIAPEYIEENNLVKDFNHFDFVWGLRAAEEVYRPIVRTIADAETASGIAGVNCLL